MTTNVTKPNDHLGRVFLILIATLSIGAVQERPAQAGAWSSGGGELIGHLHNPWFLQSVDAAGRFDPIRYCVESSQDFPQRIDTLETIVKAALDRWHAEFSNAYVPVNTFYMAGEKVQTTVTVIPGTLFGPKAATRIR